MLQARPCTRPSRAALILSGGGARAAYQAGVLRAIAELLPAGSASPFPIICGTSSGAINATALAAGACNMQRACEMLCSVWSSLTVHDIYRADSAYLLRTGLRWLRSLLPRGQRPASLLDNTPLARLLAREIAFPAIHDSIATGALHALAITASSYRTGMSVSFCMGAQDLALWRRAQRVGVRAEIGVPHLIASSAIPLVFPPAAIDGEFFGDGAINQIAPIAPALHLGADRVLVVGVAGTGMPPPTPGGKPPSLAQIGSHVLAAIFTDALGSDVEKVRFVNDAVRQIPPERLAASPDPLRDVDLLVFVPSVSLEALALEYEDRLPGSMRALLRRLGGTGPGGAGLLSYLLFDGHFCAALIELGYRDAKAQRQPLMRLLQHDPVERSVGMAGA